MGLLRLPRTKMMSPAELLGFSTGISKVSQTRSSVKASDRTARFHHLPMTDTEAVSEHVLLAQFARGPASPDFVTKSPKKPSVMGREFSACSHNPN